MPATVPVVVAAAALAYGDPVAPNKLRVARYPVGLAPRGAFSSLEQLNAGQTGVPVALVAIAPNEPILASRISGPGGRASVSVQIAPGMRAYAIKISDVAGVGGQALPGDHVDVVLAREPATQPNQAPGHDMISDVVVQNVRLLGVNLNIDPASTAAQAASDPRTATLEVSLEDAQKLAVAAGIGSLSLALRGAGAGAMTPTRQIEAADLSPGGPRTAPRPGLPRGEPRSPHALSGRSSVQVVEGEKDASVSVPVETHGGV
jgi:pilus assembly protein CpaB